MSVPYRKILLPLDGSPLAANVLEHINWLARPGSASLILVSAIDTWRYAIPSQEFVMHDLVAGVRTGTAQYLEEVRQQFAQKGYQVTTQLVDGEPAQVILDVASEQGADLIAMSTHGRSGLARWTLGSVAERVLHGASVPIFLVRSSTKLVNHKPQKILVPLDGSTVAEAALAQAEALARTNNAQILLLQVIQRLDERSQSLLFRNAATAKEIFAEWRAGAESYLELIVDRLARAGVTADYRVTVDNPDQAICILTKGDNIDLVVMGTHGRSGVGRWVYGSVANQVLRGAHSPLLLVRTLNAA